MKLRIIYNGLEYKIQGMKRFLFKDYWDDMETYEVALLARCSKGSYIKDWKVVKEYN